MDDEDNWGLQAVVRSCGGASTASAAAAASSSCSCSSTTSSFSSTCFASPAKEEVGTPGDHRQLGALSNALDDFDPLGELVELFKPFLPKPPSPQNYTTVSLPPATKEESLGSPPSPVLFSNNSASVAAAAATAAACGEGGNPSGKRPLASRQQTRPRGHGPSPGVSNSRSKRRKNLVKKVVCQVPAEALCNDVWAWRKYGQKPIKGSPFPRGYYRCSSSKGCPARKQVERSRTDPGMFVITYTSEHNHAVPTHRSCLAGSTRNKSPPLPFPVPEAPAASDDAAAARANPLSSFCSKAPSVSYSPLSSVEEELLLPMVPEDAVMGPAAGAGCPEFDEDGLLVVSGMGMDEMLDGLDEECCSGGSYEDDGMLFSTAAGF